MPTALRSFAAAAGLLLGGCISLAPETPPPRLFDCRAACARLGGQARPLPMPQVVGETGTGLEFAVRVGPHELALDASHRWLLPPELLVEAALWRALYVDGPAVPADGPGALVRVRRFEFDLTGAPAAAVELQCALAGHAVVAAGRAEAAVGDAQGLAAAMASALAQALQQLRAALLPGTDQPVGVAAQR